MTVNVQNLGIDRVNVKKQQQQTNKKNMALPLEFYNIKLLLNVQKHGITMVNAYRHNATMIHGTWREDHRFV